MKVGDAVSQKSPTPVRNISAQVVKLLSIG